ncbi:MAG: hypothetical protein V3V67_03140 [Myxococcota bacterium]
MTDPILGREGRKPIPIDVDRLVGDPEPGYVKAEPVMRRKLGSPAGPA